MTGKLADLLIDTGLLQFGSFKKGDFNIPLNFCLNMLPAYPEVLMQVVSETLASISNLPVQRLVSTGDAIPFGVALSLNTQIPLVYSRGTAEAPVFDLVGAYDTGHSAILLVNTLVDFQSFRPLISAARQVGLEIHSLISIIDFELTPEHDDLSIISILKLPDLIRELSNTGRIPTGQAEVILDWIYSKRVNG